MSIALPRSPTTTTVTLDEAMRTRRSCRTYAPTPVSLERLAHLLWAAQGRTGEDNERATPSAGRQYPLQTRVLARRVDELSSGLYQYDEHGHALRPVAANGPELADAVIDHQPWVDEAPVVIAISADIGSMSAHFATQPPAGERGARYAYMETGAAVQNILLLANALGLGGVFVAGFDDAKVSATLALPPTQQPTALVCIGVPV